MSRSRSLQIRRRKQKGKKHLKNLAKQAKKAETRKKRSRRPFVTAPARAPARWPRAYSAALIPAALIILPRAPCRFS